MAPAATGGDILMARLMVRGVAGVVTDGGLRDVNEVRRLGQPDGPLRNGVVDLRGQSRGAERSGRLPGSIGCTRKSGKPAASPAARTGTIPA